MQKLIRILLVVAMVGLFTGACEDDSALENGAEDVGERMEEGAEDAGDAMEEGAEDLEEGINNLNQ